MKKILAIILLVIFLITTFYYLIIYYVPYSEGVRSGELIKISSKGVLFKTLEGEISQGISGAQIFKFSVESNKESIVNNLKELQGKYVKVTYIERFGSFFWLGDTKYFITDVVQENSPHFNNFKQKNND